MAPAASGGGLTMAEHGKYCPIMVAGANMYVSQCIGKDCTWWLPYANDCALPVIAGNLTDIWAAWEPPYCPNCGAQMDEVSE